eukprot:CAMPEP_0201556970 /NCGR_PEP_ID=MMETSP0173_2-20130828/58794_1 /ASSEMBLY_ACC=CAM_ASM_000268 /TAXON_ID=218659 /ORGANISM="Vexillifera sp., Strain DIVA3 564/2" /LENGTH=391 /DNA_ID=CAMNT_0047969551 /DNA_START=143 /DNA_END=1318 /DNA_ORIENTATION=+
MAKGFPLDRVLPTIPKIRRSSTVPLKGGEIQIGEVYMDIKLGSPAVTYTAQVDTGSSDFAVPDTDCGRSCGQPPEIYDPSKSSTSEPISCSAPKLTCDSCHQGQCQYTIAYADSSGYDARVFSDDMIIGNFSKVVQDFGGIFRESNPGGSSFEPPTVDGIVGFAYQALSEINAPTPMDNLVASRQATDVFSMCLTDDGGSMTLGGIGGGYQGQIQYTPIIEPLYYTVFVEDMLLGGESFGLPPSAYNDGDAIIDSGTTLTYLQTRAFSAFKHMLQANCSTIDLVGVCANGAPIKFRNLFNGYCFRMTQSDINKFPTMQVKMRNNVVIDIPPKYYLVPGFCGSPNLISLGVQDGGSGFGTIYGDSTMRSQLSVFDRANQQMGFAPIEAKNCQ